MAKDQGHTYPQGARDFREQGTQQVWDSPNLCPGELAGAGMHASLDAWSFLQVSRPLGFLPSAASPVQIHHLGGLALNPSLHVTFSTVFLCLCVCGDDVIESSSILGPQDMGCGYCFYD